MTDADYERISEVDWGKLNPLYAGRTLFRQLTDNESANTPYSHKIVADGPTCPFLVDNLCYIHNQRGGEFKPAICQLFPYCFSETPSGVYATVSFVSVGALYNSGKPLVQQQEWVEKKWSEFKHLYPDYKPDWSKIKLTVDQPINWDDYIKLEEQLLAYLGDTSRSLEERMLRGSVLVGQNVRKPGSDSTQGLRLEISEPKLMPLPLNALDMDLLVIFHGMYFPCRTLKSGEVDFNVLRLFNQTLFGKKQLKFPEKRTYTFGALMEAKWPDRDPEIEDLLYRYIYSYIFGKKYFGAGFGQVSVLAGYHHLVLLLALIKLQSRASALMRGSDLVSMVDVAASVRQSERLVGETKLGGWTSAAWEMMLFSPMRANRFLVNS